MDISEFTFVDRGQSQHLDPYWLWNSKVGNVLGEFSLKIFDEGESPSQLKSEDLQQASELVTYVREHGDYLRRIVFASYCNVRDGDSHWLEISKVPKDLTPTNVGAHTGMGIILTAGKPSAGRICITPSWDEEHGLSLDLQNGTIISINGEPFAIQDEHLVFNP